MVEARSNNSLSEFEDAKDKYNLHVKEDLVNIPQKRRRMILSIPVIWCMPSRWTFQIKPIKELLIRYNVGIGWADPFAGKYSPAQITNDLNPEMDTTYHLEAEDFTYKLTPYWNFLFDPPYSLSRVAACYKSFGIKGWTKDNPTGGFNKVKDRITELTTKNNIVISFGWNTIGLGKKRGFEKIDGLCLEHGGNRNNTLVIVERKL